jgi:hypothetical protein
MASAHKHDQKGENMGEKPEDVFDKVALENKINDMIKEHKAAMASKDAMIADRDKQIASLESQMKTMVTQDAAQKMAETVSASKVKEAMDALKAGSDRDAAFKEYSVVAAAVGLDIETEKKRMEKFSAAEIKAQTEFVQRIAANTNTQLPTYQADPAGAGLEGEFGLTVGDCSSGTWKRGAKL